jgi:mannose-6-phosphate isomerase-like protein (cupin superfamily)
MKLPYLGLLAAISALPLTSPFVSFLGAQTAQRPNSYSHLEWENEQLRISRVSIAPGDRLSGDSQIGSVMVFLTADLDGRMPAAEAVWYPADPRGFENRARTRFEALLIELKDAPSRSGDATLPEAVRYGDTAESWTIVDNPRISVMKQRFPGASDADPLHFHPNDLIAIYLRGGYAWPLGVTYYDGPGRVTRGDVRIVPANTLHRFGNAGFDPLEFLVIVPR